MILNASHGDSRMKVELPVAGRLQLSVIESDGRSQVSESRRGLRFGESTTDNSTAPIDNSVCIVQF